MVLPSYVGPAAAVRSHAGKGKVAPVLPRRDDGVIVRKAMEMQSKHEDNPLDIKIGSSVQCRDGRGGRVLKFVVEPGSKRMTDIVVEHGLVMHHDVVVPLGRVARADGDKVELDMDIADLNRAPEFREVDFVMPDAEWVERHGYPQRDTLISMETTSPLDFGLAPAMSAILVESRVNFGIPDGDTPVDRGTRISCHDGHVGKLDHLLLDPKTGKVRALVVRKGHVLAKDVAVPVSWVESADEDEVVLGVAKDLVGQLPDYHSEISDA